MPEPGKADKDFRFPGRFRSEGRSRLDTVHRNDKLLGALFFSRRESSFERDVRERPSPFGVPERPGRSSSGSPPPTRRDWMDAGRSPPANPSREPGSPPPAAAERRATSTRRLQSPLSPPPPPPPSTYVRRAAAAELSVAAADARAREQAALLERLDVDDLVVHSQHGVARFKGVRRESPTGAGDAIAYVVLEFAVREPARSCRRGCAPWAGSHAGVVRVGQAAAELVCTCEPCVCPQDGVLREPLDKAALITRFRPAGAVIEPDAAGAADGDGPPPAPAAAAQLDSLSQPETWSKRKAAARRALRKLAVNVVRLQVGGSGRATERVD
jgi:hypothetical protein